MDGAFEPGCPERAAADEFKTLMLCAQAPRALEVAIGAECRDEVVQDLVVVEVMPDPTVRRRSTASGRPSSSSSHWAESTQPAAWSTGKER
jgi:hypothetical protein